MRHDKPRFKGLTTAEGVVDVLTNKIINLGAPTNPTDAARLQDITDAVGGFYANTVKESDDSLVFTGISVFSFQKSSFYLTQNAPNTDEVQINLRPEAASSLDHGLLSGLADDDHTQYILASGTRPFAGAQSMGTNRLTNLGAPTSGTDAARLQDIGPGFYGSVVKHTDDSVSLGGIKVFAFNVGDFYVTQNAPNTDEAVISLRADVGDGLRKKVLTFGSSVEWQAAHNLNTADITWSAYDDAREGMIPARVDVSDPNTAYFYFAEAVAGRAVLIG